VTSTSIDSSIKSFSVCPINPILILAVGYTMDTMYFNGLDNTVEIDKDLQLPQFFLQNHVLYDCSQNYTAGNSHNRAGFFM